MSAREMDTQNVDGKIVFITGASAGVGRAVAFEFAKRAHIGLIARGKDRLEPAKRQVEENGRKALVLHADAAILEQLTTLPDR